MMFDCFNSIFDQINQDLYDLPDSLLVSSGAITGVHQSHVGAVGEFEYSNLETQMIRLVSGGMRT